MRSWINGAGEPNMSHRGREYRAEVRCGNNHIYETRIVEEWGGMWADEVCPECGDDGWEIVAEREESGEE